jgi:hypothetical protein
MLNCCVQVNALSEIRTGQLDIFRIARHSVTKDRFPQADSDEQREVGINPLICSTQELHLLQRPV